jgi:Fe-S cluster assembly protein SufD
MNARSNIAAPVDRYCAEFERLAPQLPGNSVRWVRRMRQLAIERFAELGFPSVRDEQWKYTNVEPLAKFEFQPGRNQVVATVEGVVFDDLPAHRFVFVNGRYSAALSQVNRLPAGLEITSLADTLEREPDRLGSAFANQLKEADSAFAALNTALMADGAVIWLAPGTVVEKPIYLVFVTSGDAAIHVRNLVIVGESAQATIIEQHGALNGAAYFTNCQTRIIAGANAQIEHYKVQMESSKAFHIAGVHGFQARDSRFTSHSIALGARLARADITTRFDGEGCECLFNGLYVVDGRQHVDHHTRIDHAKPRCVSREYYRGVLDGASRGVFNGKVIVHPDAQKTDAQQSNHNLLLSEQAEVDTKPELEIYADDVKCAHGATVGQLDENMLFYLRSRGVQKELAKGLLVYAFAHEVIGRMQLAPVVKHLEKTLIARLPEGVREFV